MLFLVDSIYSKNRTETALRIRTDDHVAHLCYSLPSYCAAIIFEMSRRLKVLKN